jgi:peptidoglycan/LPS O-acetylase OafA/YrhL
MDLEINTPALLFPATSFLLLAYGNRYVAIAARIRQLAKEAAAETGLSRVSQIGTLRQRIGLIRAMQTLAVASMLCCLISMLLLYLDDPVPGKTVFGLGLMLLIASLIVTLFEIQLSTKALDQELAELSA